MSWIVMIMSSLVEYKTMVHVQKNFLANSFDLF